MPFKGSHFFTSPAKFRSLFRKVRNIVLISHPNPDGDAVGSSLGLFHILSERKFRCSVVLPNSFADYLAFLPGSQKIIFYDTNKESSEKKIKSADLIIILDFNTIHRLEGMKEVLNGMEVPVVLIDHHRQPEIKTEYVFWDINASSTCELVYNFTKKMFPSYRFSKKAAMCLYAGAVTDTGSFRYASVKSSTHLMLAELMKTGIHHHEIHEAIFDQFSLDRFKLMAIALEKLCVVQNRKMTYIYLSSEDLQKCNYQKGDTEGFVNIGLSIRGVVLSAFFMQQENYIKVSLRSKGNVDVNRMARKYFNGGGHLNAAGGKWFGTEEELFTLLNRKDFMA